MWNSAWGETWIETWIELWMNCGLNFGLKRGMKSGMKSGMKCGLTSEMKSCGVWRGRTMVLDNGIHSGTHRWATVRDYVKARILLRSMSHWWRPNGHIMEDLMDT